MGGVGVRGHYQLCTVFQAKELMMPEEGAIPPRLLQANVTEALEDEFVDGFGHDCFLSWLVEQRFGTSLWLEQGFDVLRYDEQQGGECPDEEGVEHGESPLVGNKKATF